MFKVVLYYDDETYFDIDFESYKDANEYLGRKMKADNSIIIGKILRGKDDIKVISNIGFYDEARGIIYGYWR